MRLEGHWNLKSSERFHFCFFSLVFCSFSFALAAIQPIQRTAKRQSGVLFHLQHLSFGDVSEDLDIER
jgi:hypothetical protein